MKDEMMHPTNVKWSREGEAYFKKYMPGLWLMYVECMQVPEDKQAEWFATEAPKHLWSPGIGRRRAREAAKKAWAETMAAYMATMPDGIRRNLGPEGEPNG